VPLDEEIPLKRGCQTEVPPLKGRYFTTINSSSVKTAADKHRLATYHITSTAIKLSVSADVISMTLNDLKHSK